MEVSLFSPAKINLFLAVTGRRPDGFHDLVSVVAPLDFGDELVAKGGRSAAKRPSSAKAAEGGQFTLECDHPEVPADGSNLVLRAAAAFAAATGWPEPVHFRLAKRIPPGAGLGGGSSNAVAALRALNQLAGGRMGEKQLATVAGALGSDCALFVGNQPVVMRGRGDQVAVLPESAAARLRGRRVLVFKPSLGIGTAWAYQRMAARGGDYLPAAEADPASPRLRRTEGPAGRIAEIGVERWVQAWIGSQAAAEELLFNNMEPAAFEKYPALPLLQAKLQREFGVAARMSGSGSACYALLGDAQAIDSVTRMKLVIRECWGAGALVQEARLA